MRLKIKHLPTGEEWESVNFEAEEVDNLHDIAYNATKLYLDTPTQGRFYFNEKILSECVINVKP